jgi:hypothetical protein
MTFVLEVTVGPRWRQWRPPCLRGHRGVYLLYPISSFQRAGAIIHCSYQGPFGYRKTEG